MVADGEEALGAVGGVAALWLRGMPFTVRTAVRFVALSGVAILKGLVLVEFIKQKLQAGTPLAEAVRQGCLVPSRPVLMGALVAAVADREERFSSGAQILALCRAPL